MKKSAFYLLLAMGILANAQDFRGTAVYESKTTLDLSGTNENGEEVSIDLGDDFKEQLAKAMEKTYTLHFDRTASVYEENEKLATPTGGTMVHVNFGASGKQYRNVKAKTSIIESDIFDKAFLIVDSLKAKDWKMAGETKKIGNYTCYKATYTIKPQPLPEVPEEDKKVNILSLVEKETVITAWYTPDIPVSHGPGEYWGLPGLILEVNDGRTTLLCSKITLNPKEKVEIKAPTKGDKVTQAEYDAIMEKKLNEMDQMDGTIETRSDGTRTSTQTRVIRIGG